MFVLKKTPKTLKYNNCKFLDQLLLLYQFRGSRTRGILFSICPLVSRYIARELAICNTLISALEDTWNVNIRQDVMFMTTFKAVITKYV